VYEIIFIFFRRLILAKIKSFSVVRCKDCRHWSKVDREWNNNRPCNRNSEDFFVDGGDGTDSLYTSPNFGCTDGKRK
jgi:hypothetical protein